jgi:hypothetical protein
MKIRKYTEFIKEELHDTPESYISTALSQIKVKIDKMFDFQEEDSDDKIQTIDNVKRKSKDAMSFKDLGVELESSEISKYSKLYDSLTVKFSDVSGWYSLIIMIDIKEGIPKDPEKDFDFEDITKCYVKFKKYNNEDEIVGQLTKTIDIKDINEDLIIDFKIELDDKFGDDSDKLEYETE